MEGRVFLVNTMEVANKGRAPLSFLRRITNNIKAGREIQSWNDTEKHLGFTPRGIYGGLDKRTF
jgi:hypothetical protein